MNGWTGTGRGWMTGGTRSSSRNCPRSTQSGVCRGRENLRVHRLLGLQRFRTAAALCQLSPQPHRRQRAQCSKRTGTRRVHSSPPPGSNHVYVSHSRPRSHASSRSRSTIRKPRHPLSEHSQLLQRLHGRANLTLRDPTRRRNPRHPPRVPEQRRARACRGSTAPPAPRVSRIRFRKSQPYCAQSLQS